MDIFKRKSPEEIELNKLDSSITSKYKNFIAQSNSILIELTIKVKQLVNNNSSIEHNKTTSIVQIQQAEQYIDGGIIGDGTSDYTKDTKKYVLNLNGIKIQLLDVPGIEGEESIVKENIINALKASHMVFYVKRDTKLPEEGTLQKIHNQLGSQTEIYTIYNHSITNPKQMSEDGLSTQEFSSQLAEIDAKMTEYFHEQYQGSFPVSTLPAFLVLSSTLVPGYEHFKESDKYKKLSKQRTKFSENMDLQDVLNFTNLLNFKTKFLVHGAANYKAKITEANDRKVKALLKDGINYLVNLEDSYEESIIKFEDIKNNANKRIDYSLKRLIEEFRKQNNLGIAEFLKRVRKDTTDYIDNGGEPHEDYKVKDHYKKCVTDQQKQMNQELKVHFDESLIKFKEELNDILEELSIRFENVAQNFIGLDISQNSKTWDIVSITSAVAGVIIAVISGADFIILGSAIVLSIVVGVKKIFGWFSSAKKRQYQKESVDRELNKFKKNLESNLKKDLINKEQSLVAQLDIIKKAIQKEIDNYVATKKDITKCKFNLEQLKKEI
ncbi:MAG: hypothetical protein ATN32_08335 [Candidatus Epulonipiscium fishelsonii]|nr:MAG: hypothetical protein ATN32_08335 [Epulopiscium sp. AS2M-Bin002]